MDGEQIGHHHGPVHPLLPNALHGRIFHHRQGGGEALVSTARDNDHRQLAAAHTSVRPGRRPGSQPGFPVIPRLGHQLFSDHGPVTALQSLLGDGPVQLGLLLDGLADVLQVHAVGKVQNVLHREQLLQRVFLHGLGHFLLLQHLPVAADMHQVGVLVHHPHSGHIVSRSDLHQDVKGVGGVQRQNGHPLLG